MISAGTGRLPQFGQRAFGQDGAVVDNANPVAEPFGFVEVVRRVDHGGALGGNGPDEFENVRAGLRVEADRRLVHQHRPRSVQQPGGDVEASQHAAGEPFHRLGRAFSQADTRQNRVDPRTEIRAAQPVQASEKRQIVPG